MQRYLPLMMIIGCMAVAHAGTVIIDFEDLADGTPVTNQYPSVVFTNATVFTAGISLNEFEFPPHSGSNVIFDDGGPITITFTTPVSSFAGYFTYLVPITLTGFDASNNQIGNATSLFSSNLALSGDPGSTPNELLSLIFAGGIKTVSMSGDSVGSSFTLDDGTIPSAMVPEPRSGFCILIIFCVFLIHRLHNRATRSQCMQPKLVAGK